MKTANAANVPLPGDEERRRDVAVDAVQWVMTEGPELARDVRLLRHSSMEGQQRTNQALGVILAEMRALNDWRGAANSRFATLEDRVSAEEDQLEAAIGRAAFVQHNVDAPMSQAASSPDHGAALEDPAWQPWRQPSIGRVTTDSAGAGRHLPSPTQLRHTDVFRGPAPATASSSSSAASASVGRRQPPLAPPRRAPPPPQQQQDIWLRQPTFPSHCYQAPRPGYGTSSLAGARVGKPSQWTRRRIATPRAFRTVWRDGTG